MSTIDTAPGLAAADRPRRNWLRDAGLAAAIAVAVAVPWTLPSYWLSIATLALIYGILAIGLNLLMATPGSTRSGRPHFLASALTASGSSRSRTAWPGGRRLPRPLPSARRGLR